MGIHRCKSGLVILLQDESCRKSYTERINVRARLRLSHDPNISDGTETPHCVTRPNCLAVVCFARIGLAGLDSWRFRPQTRKVELKRKKNVRGQNEAVKHPLANNLKGESSKVTKNTHIHTRRPL